MAYCSRRLKPAETKKKAIHLECLAIKQAITYWQYWLIGREFIIITDHKPLEILKVKARTDEFLGDLVYYLSQFDFTIKYACGEDNIEADALSRNPVLESFEEDSDVLEVVNLATIEDIVDDQRANHDYIRSSRNIIQEGRLSFKCIKNRKRLIVSKDFGRWLIRRVHDFNGHIGRHHIAAKLRPFYYFRNMDPAIDELCRACQTCVKNKTRTYRPLAKLSKLGPALKPFQIISIDTIGGFAGNRSPKKYMHLSLDYFSRKAFIATSKHQTRKDFIKLIDRVTHDKKVETILTNTRLSTPWI